MKKLSKMEQDAQRKAMPKYVVMIDYTAQMRDFGKTIDYKTAKQSTISAVMNKITEIWENPSIQFADIPSDLENPYYLIEVLELAETEEIEYHHKNDLLAKYKPVMITRDGKHFTSPEYDQPVAQKDMGISLWPQSAQNNEYHTKNGHDPVDWLR
jgi:hypothetical protein